MPRSYIAGTSTAVAPVAAIPTTAAHFVLYNAEPAGGKSYLITSVGFTTVTSAAATMIVQLLATIGFQTNNSPPVGTTAKGPIPLDGGVKDSRGVSLSGATIVNNGIWHPVGPSFNTAALTATIGAGSWVNVRGIYTLAPGGLLALATLGSTAAGASQLFATWEES